MFVAVFLSKLSACPVLGVASLWCWLLLFSGFRVSNQVAVFFVFLLSFHFVFLHVVQCVLFSLVVRASVSRLPCLLVKPSIQALRAETMVERFTARMHVREIFYVLLDCSGS